MRKIADSSNTRWTVAFNASADARSRPNGFSTTRRASFAQPERSRPRTTIGNKLGGIAR
jgi:hypothetical protein